MIVKKTIDADDFNFWDGAKQVWAEVCEHERAEEIKQIVDLYISEQYPEGIDATEFNDFIWMELEKFLWESYQIDLYGDHSEE